MLKFFKKRTDTENQELAQDQPKRKFSWFMIIFIIPFLTIVGLGLYWDVDKPFFGTTMFSVKKAAQKRAEEDLKNLPVGYITTSTLIEIVNFMLTKPGGFVTNDMLPPGVFMDNTANWEFGVITLVRDFSRLMRNDISRAQSQSGEDQDLMVAEPSFNFDTEAWILPSSEGEYEKGDAHLAKYLARLRHGGSQFYARSDNLREWLNMVAKRLGNHSAQLGSSVGKIDRDLDGMQEASPATEQASVTPNATEPPPTLPVSGIPGVQRTPWYKVDDYFYEARGYCWALLHLTKAISIDFKDVLERKNAMVGLKQIMKRLEETQSTLMSPMVLNGDGFGPFANHSLVLSSYIARVNASIIDLANLLQQG